MPHLYVCRCLCIGKFEIWFDILSWGNIPKIILTWMYSDFFFNFIRTNSSHETNTLLSCRFLLSISSSMCWRMVRRSRAWKGVQWKIRGLIQMFYLFFSFFLVPRSYIGNGSFCTDDNLVNFYSDGILNVLQWDYEWCFFSKIRWDSMCIRARWEGKTGETSKSHRKDDWFLFFDTIGIFLKQLHCPYILLQFLG